MFFLKFSSSSPSSSHLIPHTWDTPSLAPWREPVRCSNHYWTGTLETKVLVPTDPTNLGRVTGSFRLACLTRLFFRGGSSGAV